MCVERPVRTEFPDYLFLMTMIRTNIRARPCQVKDPWQISLKSKIRFGYVCLFIELTDGKTCRENDVY